jgi:pantetheine-phosphate adenylyltransferase
MKRAIVPGTFDPITSGHLDVISRAAQTFDEVIVAVAESVKKSPLFPQEVRVDLVREVTKGIPNVRVIGFDGLLVDTAHEYDAHVVVKGLRVTTDFEYEFQQTALNYELNPELETLFMMSPPKLMFLSSSVVREMASMGGDLHDFVPPTVAAKLKEHFAEAYAGSEK